MYDPVVHVWLAYVSFDIGDWEGVVREVELAQELVNMNDAHFAKLWELLLPSKLNMDPAQVRPEDFDELVRRYSENLAAPSARGSSRGLGNSQVRG